MPEMQITEMNTPSVTSRRVGTILFVLLVAVVAIGLWKIETRPSGRLVAVERRPERMMGTICKLAAVVARDDSRQGMAALRESETVLRGIEAHMSCWLDDSEISRLNRAKANVPVSLTPEVIKVLQLADEAYQTTGGAFDVTCRPLIELWKQAAQRNRLPTNQEIAASRAESQWNDIRIQADSVEKRLATASVDLGGIAKGHAIDRALAAMQDADVEGGLIDVGGDVAFFGRPTDNRFWRVDVQNPFRRERLATLRLIKGAVCTSGDYARYRLVGGHRYSHILDPRTGRPASSVPSVTVVAPDAVTADVWATALSVLGPEGLKRLPRDVEALLIVGTASSYKIYCTHGILAHLERRLPIEPIVVDREPTGQTVN